LNNSQGKKFFKKERIIEARKIMSGSSRP